MSFMGIYAARLGATSLQLGLISASPAIVNLLFTLPAGRWLEKQPLIYSSFWFAVLQRLWYIAFILLPWLLPAAGQVWAMIVITLLMSIPSTYLVIAFNAVFPSLVPADWMAHVLGRRNALVSIGLSIGALVSGQLLDRIDYPINYQIVFAIGAIGALLSSYHIGKLSSDVEPVPPFYSLVKWVKLSGRSNLTFGRRLPVLRSPQGEANKSLLRLDVLRSSFGLFMLSYLLFYTFQYALFPLIPLYFVNVLHLTDGAISLGTGLFHLVVMMVSWRLASISARLGHKRLLVLGGILFGLYPLLIYLGHDATLYWVASFTGGIFWGLLGASLINRLMQRVPSDDRPAYMAIHNMALNVGILAGSMLGPSLNDWFGLRDAVLATAFLRLVGGLLLWWWG
jgi:predicted MFS family arabinose efflux permease